MPLLRYLVAVILVLGLGVSAPVGAETPQEPPDPVFTIATSMGEITVALYAREAPATVANFIALAEGTREFIDARTGLSVRRPFYDGLTFHRVIPGFMIQGGCPLGNGTGGPGYRFADEIDADALGLQQIHAVGPKGGLHPFIHNFSKTDVDRYIAIPLFQRLGITSQADLDARREQFDAAMAALTLKSVYEAMGYRYSAQGSPHPPRRGSLAMANSGPNTNGSQFFINLADNDWLAGRHTVFGHVLEGMAVVEAIAGVATGRHDKPLSPVLILTIRRASDDGVPVAGSAND